MAVWGWGWFCSRWQRRSRAALREESDREGTAEIAPRSRIALEGEEEEEEERRGREDSMRGREGRGDLRR